MEKISEVYRDCLDILEGFKELIYHIGYKNKDAAMLVKLRDSLDKLDDKFQPDNFTQMTRVNYTVPGSNVDYKVKQLNGKWSCNCGHYLYTHTECKHIKQVKESLDNTVTKL